MRRSVKLSASGCIEQKDLENLQRLGLVTKMKIIRNSFYLLIFVFVAGLLPAHAAEIAEPEEFTPSRLAFVFGNTEYAHLPRLPNARNDAEDISEKLRTLGFQVVTGYNLTRSVFVEILSENRDAVLNAEAVLFYFAGHGLQFEGKNFLVPSDAKIRAAEDIKAQSIGLNEVIAELQDRDRPTLIFLDACRNSPLGNSDDGRIYQDGLAQLEAGDSTFIAFATQPGNVTLDGQGRNSPFTTAFLEHVKRPGLSISDLMIEVRKTVESLSYGRQVPWDQSSLRQQFYFTESMRVDPQFLVSNLATIMEDPALRTELRSRLASADPNALHQFILQNSADDVRMLSRNTSGSAESGLTASDGVGPGTVSGDVTALKSGVSSSLSSLLYEEEASGKAEAKALARRLQSELARLGCYRMAIDGIWGPGSRRSLAAYFSATNRNANDLSPSMDVLSLLFLETGRICKPPRRVAKRVDESASGVAASGQRSKARSRTSSGKAVTKKAPALPPDISAGVGIGGIF